MRPAKKLGLELHVASNLLDRRMNAMISSNGADVVTPMHGMILDFVCTKSEEGQVLYQKDIESEFDIARSTVTATLKLMEKKGYIKRSSVSHDARLKRIFPTPFGKESFARVDKSIQRAEAIMRSALTEEEHNELLRLLGLVQSALISADMDQS